MFEEYVENVVRIINENGIVARAIKDIKSDGSVDYILRLTEDPNGLKWASLKFDTPEKVTKECPEAESYAKGVIEQILKMDSPVRNARTSLSKKKYDKIKGQITPFMMDKSKYKDYLKNVPNRDFLDYSVVYCYKDEKVLITVTNDLAGSLGVTEKQLYEDSVKNIVPKGPVNLFRMLSTKSADGKKAASEDEEDGLLPVYLLSNDVMLGGASVLLLPDFLEKVSEKLGGDYYAAVSTNAFIVVTPKDNEKVSKGNLSQIGRNFSNSLSGPDTLTLQEKVYLYNSSNKKLENIK